MPKSERITFVCDESDRRMIDALAQRLQRSRSDAIRQVVLDAAYNLFSKEISPFGGGLILMNDELEAGRDQN